MRSTNLPEFKNKVAVMQLALHCCYGLAPSRFDTGAALIMFSSVDEAMVLVKQGY